MITQLSLDVAGRSHDAWLCLPEDGEPPHRGLVLIHDIFGINDDTRRHLRNFAAAGYATIMPDLYMGSPACVVRTLMCMVREQGVAFPIIEAARAHLAAREDVDAERIGVCGFCMGGGFALLAAAEGSYAVAAPFYGGVPKDRDRLAGICPTIAQFGATDRLFLPDAHRLSEHLKALDIDHEVHIREGAGHAFMQDYEGFMDTVGYYSPMNAGYVPEVEAVAWKDLLSFFDRHLGP